MRSSAPRFVSLSVALVALASGCVSEELGWGDLAPSTDGVETDAPARCPARSTWVGSVTGRLVDTSGAALAGERVSLCGALCVPATTRSDGRFSVHAGLCFPWSRAYPGGAVFVVDGGGYHADVSIALAPEGRALLDDVALGDVRVPSMLASPSVVVPLAGDDAQRLTLPDGFSLGVSPGALELPPGALNRVSAVRVARDQLPRFALADDVGALYALTPSGARCTTPAAVTLPNDLGLAAGAEVEIVMAGDVHESDVLPPGTVGVVDTGRVTSDGRAVVADHGLPFLGWVGYREAARR